MYEKINFNYKAMKKLSMDELGRISCEEFKQKNKIPVVVILDNIRSMNNIGSIFRTADAFSVEHLYLCGITAQPPQKEITKTALGATESVDWTYVCDTLEIVRKLQMENYRIYAVEQVDQRIFLQDFTPDFSQKTALILGNEVFGVDEKLLSFCDGCIEIPQEGIKHSLNVSVAAGIILWDFYFKFLREGKINPQK